MTVAPDGAAAVRHPAKYSDSVLSAMSRHIAGRTLDPFAGTGRIHELPKLAPLLCGDVLTVGLELEPEWARLHARTVQGDALHLPFASKSFDCVATSPTYGNRMADHHEARDTSTRLTYRHSLGRSLHPNNSGQLQWGASYRHFHTRAWGEVRRILRDGGRLLLNVSDHVRKGQVQRVVEWHRECLLGLGFRLLCEEAIPTPRMRFGQNGSARVAHESLLVFEK